MDYVLVHGTTQSPGGWKRLTEVLERRGHRVVLVDLPIDQPSLTVADYAGLAEEQVAGEVRQPVVVAHSGAGLLLAAIGDALAASRLVWLAAFVPDTTSRQSLVDEVDSSGGEIFTAEWRSLTEPPTADPVVGAYFLFHDCDLATLRSAIPTMRLFYPATAYAEKPSHPPTAPSTYLLPTGDRTLRPDWMRRMAVDRLGVEPIELDGGHCVHVSRPEAVADQL